MIFLDNASTTRVSAYALEQMILYQREAFFNPSALYNPAYQVHRKLDEARNALASRLHIAADELIFTSGATEANTWALQCGLKNRKANLVISAGEHASVYENAMALKNKGIDLRIVPLSSDGTIDMAAFDALVDDNTGFISVLHCSNETGAVNDIQTLVKLSRKKNPKVIWHSDGVQAFGKIPADLSVLGVDMYSISAHKIGGPKGIGALAIRKPFVLPAMILGGGQERGLRSGTENVGGIIGFCAAAETYSFDIAKIRVLKSSLLEILEPLSPQINGSDTGSPHVVSLSFSGIKSEVLQHMLSDAGVYIGLGSACSGRSKYNRVLAAMGLPQKKIEGSIRISFGTETTLDEVVEAGKIIVDKVNELRGKIIG